MGKIDSSTTVVAAWPVRLKPGADGTAPVPETVLTHTPAIEDEDMPPEVALLLPTNLGPQALIDACDDITAYDPSVAIGLFMSDPFLATSREARRLIGMGVQWVCNLPTVDQQDEEFTQQLADVGLDRSREYASLAGFKSAGLKIAVAVSVPEGAREAASLNPEAMIVLPRISDFAAGFPSPRQRGAAAQTIRDALKESGWRGPLLGYGDERETDHPSQWPDSVDGMLFRPSPTQLSDLTG